jgi:hypothetical protein
MLTFIENSNDKRKALFQCECGNVVEAFKSNVSRGHTSSCGCLRKKVTRERSLKHGQKTNRKPTKTYAAWVNMKGRCENTNRPDADNYVLRGITVCERWDVFENFLADMGEAPEKSSLDRIDNNKGYYKENCRWATAKEQNLNKRNNVRYEYEGQSKTISEWAEEYGIGRVTLFKRLQRGIDMKTALSTKGYLSMSKTKAQKPRELSDV